MLHTQCSTPNAPTLSATHGPVRALSARLRTSSSVMSTMLGGMLPDKWLFCTHGAGEQSGQQGKGRVFTRDKMPQLSEFLVFLITLPKTRLSCPALHYLSSFGPPGDSAPAAPPSTMSALSAEQPVIPRPAFLVLLESRHPPPSLPGTPGEPSSPAQPSWYSVLKICSP